MRVVVLTSAVRRLSAASTAALPVSMRTGSAACHRRSDQTFRICKEDVDEVIAGMVLPAAGARTPARQAAVRAGMPGKCLTVNKVCGSGLKSVMLATQA